MKTSILLMFLVVFSCGKSPSDSSSSPLPEIPSSAEMSETKKGFVLTTPDGEEILTSRAFTTAEKNRGLSGVRPENFSDNMGKLFVYESDSSRTFWMKDTYFDLDIFYLNKELEIIDIVRDLPAYSGTVNAEIPRARAINSRHVLEMNATSPIADSLGVGDKLRPNSPLDI